MNTIILSIKPKWAEKIYSGEKTVEFRRVVPKCIHPGEDKYVNVLLYESSPVSKVTGECLMYISSFYLFGDVCSDILKKGCLTKQEMESYSRGRPVYVLAVEGAKKWDAPKDISYYNKRAPMNYVYQPEIDNEEDRR